MPRKSFQDILKVKKVEHIKHERMEEKPHHHTLWFVAIISIVFLFFAISFVFSSAKITINPKVKQITIDQNFSALKDSNDQNQLSFDLVVLSGEDSKFVKTDEEKDYAEKAKGNIVLYNDFDPSLQKFSINTRLEGSNGKIYKTNSAVIIPGKNVDGTPGRIEVEVSGSDVGAEYNSDKLDFKVVGFKGLPKYSKIYGRSKDKIIGGLKGRSRQISDVDKKNTIDELTNSLKIKLLQKATNQIPKGYILFNDAVFLNTDDVSFGIAEDDGNAPVKLTGTLYGLILNEQQITKKIAKENIPLYDGSEISIPDIKKLVFSLKDKDSLLFNDVTKISFNLSGSARVVWRFDPEKLKNDLLGKSKNDFNQILSQHLNIGTADLVIKPVWRSSFPDKSKDIEIIVNNLN